MDDLIDTKTTAKILRVTLERVNSWRKRFQWLDVYRLDDGAVRYKRSDVLKLRSNPNFIASLKRGKRTR